jgi:hypothetical protein
MADGGKSIASDSGGLRFAGLAPDTKERLTKKFLSFRDDRENIYRRMESYVIDYASHEGSATGRYETLSEEYSDGAPNLNHLVLRDDGSALSALWSMKDIAIVLGRNVSNVFRTLRRMEETDEWLHRLEACVSKNENPGRDAATLYTSAIFDVIVDYFEYLYLERFTRPRHGTPMAEEERSEVRAFWRYMKDNPGEAEILIASDFFGLRDAFQQSPFWENVYQNLRLIVKRACSIKLGTFFLVLFAVIYELSARYPILNIAAPIVSFSSLVAVILAMRARRRTTLFLADIGACAVTLCMLWALALIASPDGPASRLLPQVLPSSLDSDRQEEPEPEISPVQKNAAASGERQEEIVGAARNDVIVEYSRSSNDDDKAFSLRIRTRGETREILYRTGSSGDFRSTGFSKDPSYDGSPIPLRSVTLKTAPLIELYVKYTGTDGTTHGPYRIEFDPATERVKQAKLILDGIDWIEFDRVDSGMELWTDVPQEISFRMGKGAVVKRMMYGINKKTPDIERLFSDIDDYPKPSEDMDWSDPSELGRQFDEHVSDMESFMAWMFEEKFRYKLAESHEKIWLVSAQLFFTDGTSSEVRMFDNPYAELD